MPLTGVVSRGWSRFTTEGTALGGWYICLLGTSLISLEVVAAVIAGTSPSSVDRREEMVDEVEAKEDEEELTAAAGEGGGRGDTCLAVTTGAMITLTGGVVDARVA